MSQRSSTRQSLTGWRCVRRPSLSFIEVLPKEQGRANGPVPPPVFFSRGQKKVVSHSSSCYHSVALTPLREEMRKNAKESEMAVATPAFFSPCKTGRSFLTQIWRVAAVPPCLMMRAVNAVHGIVRRKYLPKSPWRDYKVYLRNANRAHKGLRFLHARQRKTCSFLPAVL